MTSYILIKQKLIVYKQIIILFNLHYWVYLSNLTNINALIGFLNFIIISYKIDTFLISIFHFNKLFKKKNIFDYI